MKYLKYAATTACLGLILCVCCRHDATTTAFPANDYYVAAYVWPSCHDDPKAREVLWSEGSGEWEIIRKGNPRFEGHYQPKRPLWGYEMDNDPQVVERWIDAATSHGVNIFVYDWYWYDEGPYLESALNDGFLKARNNTKMNFYIMWANHDVKKNYWNCHRYGQDEELLWNACVDRRNFEIIVERIIRQYFSRPNYLKFDGCPVMAIFDVKKLIESFGDLDATRKALDYFRSEVKKRGYPDLHLQLIYGGGYFLNDVSQEKLRQRVKALGFDSVAFYNMGGFDPDYLVHGANALAIRKQWDAALDVPLFPCVSIGWDDTPRFPAKGAADVTRWHNSPMSFAGLLSEAKRYADSHPEQPRLITINAWNEWVEGSYLLPDMLNGFGYLEAVHDVMQGKYDQGPAFAL